MSELLNSWTVNARGIGKPDYSTGVSSALERRGITLSYGQTLKIFGLVFSNEVSPFSWIVTPLASGGTQNVIDNATGFASPITIPVGYSIALIAAGAAVSSDIVMWGYIDGFLATSIGVFSSGNTHYENKILGLTTETIDPTGLASHTIDIVIENLGGDTLIGGIELVGIIQPLATDPLPVTKTIKCKFCDYEETVTTGVSEWICPKCGKLNLFFDQSKFEGSR